MSPTDREKERELLDEIEAEDQCELDKFLDEPDGPTSDPDGPVTSPEATMTPRQPRCKRAAEGYIQADDIFLGALAAEEGRVKPPVCVTTAHKEDAALAAHIMEEGNACVLALTIGEYYK